MKFNTAFHLITNGNNILRGIYSRIIHLLENDCIYIPVKMGLQVTTKPANVTEQDSDPTAAAEANPTPERIQKRETDPEKERIRKLKHRIIPDPEVNQLLIQDQ